MPIVTACPFPAPLLVIPQCDYGDVAAKPQPGQLLTFLCPDMWVLGMGGTQEGDT